MPALSAYIHIPFCAYKCHFCDFATAKGNTTLVENYCQVLCQEIEQRLANCQEKPFLQTIFYGGGTPGLLDEQHLAKIHETLLNKVNLAQDAEITLETNPENVTFAKAKFWRKLGINRLSIGVQSFNDQELKALGRGHSCSDAVEAIKNANAASFENINCDLMYVLPGQDLKDWQNTLAQFVKLAHGFPVIKHLSAYGLEISANTPLAHMLNSGQTEYPDESIYLDQLKLLDETMALIDFEQYEISNFAATGYESAHNFNYWNQGEYYAFGMSAHRYLKPYRSSNWRAISKYLEDCMGNETCEVIDKEKARTEFLMLQFRTSKGLDLQQFQSLYQEDLFVTHRTSIEKLISHQLLQGNRNCLRLTLAGQTLANAVIGEFLV